MLVASLYFIISIVSSMAYKHIVSSFADSTSAHGVSKAVNGQYRACRVQWTVVIVLCFVVLVVQMVNLVQLYLKYETSMQLRYETLPFPAVTVCNLNPFRMSMLRDVPELAALLAAFDSAVDKGANSNRKRRSASPSIDTVTNSPVLYPELEGNSRQLIRNKRQVCDPPFAQVGSMCYYVSSTQKNQSDAAAYCISQHSARLAVLISESETLAVGSWMAGNNYAMLWTALKYDSATNKLRWHVSNTEQLLVAYSGVCKLSLVSHMECYWLGQMARLNSHDCSDDSRKFLCQKEPYDECPVGSTIVDNYCYSVMAHSPRDCGKTDFDKIESLCTAAGGRMPVIQNEPENIAFGDYLLSSGVDGEVYIAVVETSGDRYWKMNGVAESEPIVYDATDSAATGAYLCYKSDYATYQWTECSSDNRRIVCQFDRTVTTTTTTSTLVTNETTEYCNQLSLLSHGTGPTYSNFDRPVGATAQFRCDAGRVLSGNAIITCSNGGVWNSLPPTCMAQCQAIRLDTSLRISISYNDASYLQSSKATFSCDDNTPTTPHILVPTTSTCLEDATWSLPLPSQCISMSQQTVEDMQSAISIFAEVANDSMALQQTTTDIMAYFSAGLSKEQVTHLGYQFEDLVVSCRYAGTRCSDEDFQYLYDPTFSNCYSFNNKDSPTYTTNRAGANEGLLVELYVNQSDYITTTERGGAMIVIHDQQETVVADTIGYTVPMGYVTSFGVMLTKVERLGAPYSDCVQDENNDKLFYFNTKYSIEGCYRSCYQKNLIDKCSCGDPRLPIPEGGKYCSVKERTCIQNFVSDKIALDMLYQSCDCPAPCSTTIYTVVQSNAKWPANSAMPEQCRKLNEVEQLKCYDKFRKDYGRVEIYFVQTNYNMLAESAAFTFTQLLSASGGILGLFVGISAITCTEIGYLISALVAYATCKKILY